MAKLPIVTVNDIFNNKNCILDLKNSIRKNNIKDIEYFYSKLFPYGEKNICDLFNDSSIFFSPISKSPCIYPKHIEFYDQQFEYNMPEKFSN